MTPEATWLVIVTFAAVLYGAGWVGWKLRGLSDDHGRGSEATRQRLAAMRQEDDR